MLQLRLFGRGGLRSARQRPLLLRPLLEALFGEGAERLGEVSPHALGRKPSVLPQMQRSGPLLPRGGRAGRLVVLRSLLG